MAKNLIELAQNPHKMITGYAEFTRIITLKNINNSGAPLFPQFKASVVSRKQALAAGGILQTAYEARNEQELPVLTEWITGIPAESALWIHLILYSKEQLHKEGDLIDADWGLVSINASNNEVMEPMRPITAMRNALGIEEGGSEFPLDREAYLESVAFWSDHIKIKF